MKKFWIKLRNSLMAMSLAGFFTMAAAETIIAAPSQPDKVCATDFELIDQKCVAKFGFEQGSQTIVLPKNLGSIQVEVIGGAGGTGGKDCGLACADTPGGPAGRIILEYSELGGKKLFLYPGQAGANGASGVNGSGGGAAGASSFKDSFDGGRGGNTGTTGSSGAGGGGGAASVLIIDGQEYVAAGAGGGGGSANSANGSTAGSNDGRISTIAIAVNVFEGAQATFTSPAGTTFTSSKLRWESNANPRCGKDVAPDIAGKSQITIVGSNQVWGDGCVGVSKRVFGFLYYSKGSQGGNGVDSNCNFYCDGAGGGGGGGGVLGGAGGELYQAPSGAQEAAGFGGSAGSNTAKGGPVKVSDYVDGNGSGSITFRYSPVFPPSQVQFTTKGPTNSNIVRVQVKAGANTQIEAKDVLLSGSATEQGNFDVSLFSKKIVGNLSTYVFNIKQVSPAKISGSLIANVKGVSTEALQIDQVAPTAKISLLPGTSRSAVKIYDVRLNKPVRALTASSFEVVGTAKGCKVSAIAGNNLNYQVSLTDCGAGDFALSLKANSLSDELDNLGPVQSVTSELSDGLTPQVSLEVGEGEIPKQFLLKPVESIFSQLDAKTQAALEEVGIYAPMVNAPVSRITTDLSAGQPGDVFSYQTNQQVEVGSSIDLNVVVSPAIAENSDLIAFIQTGNLWQYLGRQSFTNESVSAEAFGIAKPGEFKIRLVVIAKEVVTNMSLPRSFGQAVPLRISRAVTDAETDLGSQQVDLTLSAVAPAEGLPTVVTELSPESPPLVDPAAGLLELNLPQLNIGEPVANPAIGATGDDFGPSVPFDPLGTPEAVAQVVKTTATTVAVVASVAAAASAAVGAAAGAAGAGSSSASNSTNSTNSEQQVDESDGEISNIDAQVESFSSEHSGWGDRIPIFKFRLFTFMDRFTHNLTLSIAKFSPVLSKIVNDGAYLRAILGSLWLAFPIAGVMLATTALANPGSELSPPAWQIFVAISVIGLFDAFSGLLATSIFVIGIVSTFGITSVSDIRMLLGILVMGFGPALISVAFRQIRKHVETGFSYFWDRLVDVAVLLFFTGWTVTAMVSTLPALAGKTLSAANHVADFAFFLSIAIVVRILSEEIAARSFAQRLDKINPTEVPDTSLKQKVFSTALRLAVFIFVTAAFMGNTWQVWVGSIFFILPNLFSWFQDKLPNSALLWKVIPTGIPGLAFSLLVASYSALFLGGWIGDRPDFAQWSFMLLPIPMFIVGLIALFGREGREGEERPILRRNWRWVYRLGGVLMLLLTAQLAGVI